MAKVLVTGGCGMIGSNLVKKMIQFGYDVDIVDNLWRGKLEYLQGENNNLVVDIDKSFFNYDLRIPDVLDNIISDYDFIIHLADIVAGIGYVFNNQGNIFRDNMLINSNVINSVRTKAKGTRGFLYVGTACSFPYTKQNTFSALPLVESDLYPANPESAYGWSKLMGQYESNLMEFEHNISTCVLMLHNVYGSPCDYSAERGQVIPSLIRKAIRYPKEDYIVWGSGNQGRAFVHVFDVIDAILLALEKGWGEETIQIGPSVCTSIKDIAETIVYISGKDIEIKYDTTKPEGDKARAADYSLAKKVLGWEPKISLDDGLKEQYSWIERRIKAL